MDTKVLCWNCRGAASKDFLREMLDMKRTHKPTMIVLLEPQISGSEATEVCRKLGVTRWLRSEASGFSGGVYLLWNNDAIEVELLSVHKSYIHVAIESANTRRWHFTAVYASPKAHIRKLLWPELDALHTGDLWMLMGDFNCVLKCEERNTGSGVSESFAKWVTQRGLIDLGYSGQKFTWCHGGSIGTRRAARLDRSLCDGEWRRSFPAAGVKHLSHLHSDHCPLLLYLDQGKARRMDERPFRFEAMWLRHKGFANWMKKEWKKDERLMAALKEFKLKLEAWNRITFGNVFQRKKRNLLRLEGVQRSLEGRISEPMLKLERKLKIERKEILIQEELLWKQKSRHDWLKHGDGNTKFFHTSTLVRQRRNRIVSLQDNSGAWVEDKKELINMAVDYYKGLFTSEHSGGEDFMRGCFPPLSDHVRRRLDEGFALEDTRKALMAMGSLKAPGPDGYQSIFFKNTWDVTGRQLHQFAQNILGGDIIPPEAIEFLLVLIPKEERPSSIRGFRPISLCNVAVKVVSRMIVNRLKGVLCEAILPNQASFIPGRQSNDNFIICQELVHSMKYTTAKRGGMILKLDLEKAYDRLEWQFVEDTLKDAQIPHKLVEVIMEILKGSSCRLLWNGEITESFKPSRGLR